MILFKNGKENLIDILDFKILTIKKNKNNLIELKKYFIEFKIPVIPIRAKDLIKQFNLKEGKAPKERTADPGCNPDFMPCIQAVQININDKLNFLGWLALFYELQNKSKIVSLTAYSKNVASILDNHCDIILVGDSLGSVLYNYKSTKEVTLNTMIEHSKSVRMGIKKSLMIVDMPHNTYRTPKEALKNAKQIMKKTKCDGVKLEGGKKIYETIKTLVKNKIPVMGHLGLLPQSDKTFKFKGKKKLERNNIIRDSQLLEKAGVFSIVLECVETSLAKLVTQNLKIPTIGIGASKYCDGQILVLDDLIGLNPMNYKFVKKYANIRKDISKAVSSYSKEVRKIKFPNKKNSF